MSESKGPKKPTVKLFVGNLTEPCTDDVSFRNNNLVFNSVLRIRRIRMFLGLLNPNPSISKQKMRKALISSVLWLLFDFLSLKNYVKVPLKNSNMQENFFLKISFLLASWRSVMKIEGSGSASGSESESGSGSISQRHGSADPEPHQNVMDPEHC